MDLIEALTALMTTLGLTEATWDTAYINALPDAAFLIIETGGEKDSDGKTTPRSLRHFPVKDSSGKVDLPHLRNALSRIPQSKLSAELKAQAKKKAAGLAKTAGVGNAKEAEPMARRNKRILEAADQSLNDRMRMVSDAVRAAYNQGPGDYCYTEVVFDDYVILNKAGKLWRVDYTLADDGTVTLSGDPVQVRQAYVPINEGTLIAPLPDSDGPVREGETPTAPTGKRWGVLIIQEGLSKNRNRYAKKVLQEAAPLYEGAKIYMDHQEETRRYGRSTKDLAGFLKKVEGVLIGGASAEAEAHPVFGLAAVAVVTKEHVRRELLDAYEEGNPNLFGLSHDVNAESVTCMSDQGPFYDVQRIESVASVDFVTNPAAGGRVLRLVASDTVAHTLEGDGRMLTKMIEAIKASGNQPLIAKLTALGATPTEDQVLGLYQDALRHPAPAAQRTEAELAAERAAAETRAREATAAAAAAAGGSNGNAAQITEAQFLEVRKDGLLLFLENTLEGTSLHQPVKDQLRKRFSERITGATTLATLTISKLDITTQVKEQVDLFAQLAERNIVMPATGRPRAEVIQDRRDKVGAQIDAFFGIRREAKADGTVKVIVLAEGDRASMSFRNLYIDITGDVNVTGQVSEAKKLTESLTTASLDQILGDSITRRMVAEYQLQTQAEWRGTIVDVVPVTDFRTQRRMRFGGYGNLTTVAQGAPYPSMTSPTDEEATYSPAKRGGTEQLTIEMIANDDVGAIRRIPQRLSRAAYQTLREFVFEFMAANPVIYDAAALFTAGKGNLLTSALSSSNLSSLRLKIKKQADMSNGKRIGLAGRYLWVPSDLEELAFQLTTSDRVVPDASISTTAAAAAPNFQRKIGIEYRVVDYWTDLDNYFLTADVTQTPMIELGFWGGEDPSLFVQDQPNVGSLFSNDAITYKMRHVYGGAVLDYRGFAASIF